MNIVVTREACCAQDDQLGPLTLNLELSDSVSIQELAKIIGESGFLQFSGTHNIITVFTGEIKLFNIPSLAGNDVFVEYFASKTEIASDFITNELVDCKWPTNL